MLKSIVFLLVMIFLITTPTRAYEAYNFNFQQEKLIKTENLMQKNEKAEASVMATEDMCRLAVSKAEADFAVMPGLLQTIASVESGRWNAARGERMAWPWTVHANGKGYYYKTKNEAVAAVKAMQAQGLRNIDVGCMQINLRYHGGAFSSLEEAFDPEKNAAYSAQFLKKLYQRNKEDWKKTAMQYHSKNLRKGINYKNRLEKHYAQYVRKAGDIVTLF